MGRIGDTGSRRAACLDGGVSERSLLGLCLSSGGIERFLLGLCLSSGVSERSLLDRWLASGERCRSILDARLWRSLRSRSSSEYPADETERPRSYRGSYRRLSLSLRRYRSYLSSVSSGERERREI